MTSRRRLLAALVNACIAMGCNGDGTPNADVGVSDAPSDLGVSDARPDLSVGDAASDLGIADAGVPCTPGGTDCPAGSWCQPLGRDPATDRFVGVCTSCDPRSCFDTGPISEHDSGWFPDHDSGWFPDHDSGAR